MAGCDDTRQLTEAQRQAGYQNQRTGVQQAVRPFSGRPTLENLIDYINRELQPAVKRTRDKVNEVYLPVVDNAPSGNPLGFYFSTNTASGDPTAGRIRLNTSPQDTATVMRVSQSSGRLVDVAPWLDVMAGGATTPLGVVTLTDAINPARFIRFDLSTMVDQGAYWDLTVVPIESSHDDPFVDGGAVVVSFIPGVGGVTPATVPPSSMTAIAANTVIANATAATASPTAFSVGTNTVLGRVAGNIVSAQLVNAQITDATIANAKLANMVAGRMKGVQVDGATGAPQDLTGLEVAENWRRGTIQTVSGVSGTLDIQLDDDATVLLIRTTGNATLRTLETSTISDPGREIVIEHDRLSGTGILTIAHNTAGTYSRFFNPDTAPLYLGQTTCCTARFRSGFWRPQGSMNSGFVFPGSPIYDVMRPPFNAAGDGATDDTAAINAAIAAANATPGDVYLGNDHLISGALTALTGDNIFIYGRGPRADGTRITVTGASPYNVFTFDTCRDCGLADVLILGPGTWASRGLGVFIDDAFRTRIERCEIVDTYGAIEIYASVITEIIDTYATGTLGPYGFYAYGSAADGENHALRFINCGTGSDPAGTIAWYKQGSGSHTFELINCGALEGGYGLYVADDTPYTDSLPLFTRTLNFQADHCAINAIRLVEGATANFTHTFLTSTTGNAFHVESTYSGNWELNGGMIHATAGHCVYVASDHWSITGLQAGNLDAGFDCIHIDTGVSDFSITGCTLGDIFGSGSDANYGININATCTRYTVVGNRMIGNALGAVLDGPGPATSRVVQGNNPTTVNTVRIDEIETMVEGHVVGTRVDAGGTARPVSLTGAEVAELWRRGTIQTVSGVSGTLDILLNDDTTVLLIRTTADATLRSIGDGLATAGREVVIEHDRLSGTGNLTLAHNGATPTYSPFFNPDTSSVVLGQTTCCTVRLRSGFWRPQGSAQARVRDADYGDVTVSVGGSTWTIDNDVVSDAKLRNSGPLSVIGRSANTTGDPADVSATAASGAVLRESGSVLGFGTVATAGIADAAVTLAKLANLTVGTTIGRAIDAGSTGVPTALTGAQQAQQLRYTSVVTDTTSTGAQATYTIAETTTQVRANTAADVEIRGMTIPTAQGQRVVFHREPNSAGVWTFTHNSGGGTTQQQLFLSNEQSQVLGEGQSIQFEYTNNRWRHIGGTTTALTDGDKGDVTVSALGLTWTVDANIAKTWTGVHSFTGASHTIDVTGAANISADAASTITTSVGNLTLSTTAAASRVIVSGADDVLIEAVADDVFINSGGDTQLASTGIFRISTNAVERLEIETDGAWQLGGDTGDLGAAILSQGSAAPPIWANRGDVVTRTTIITGGSSAEANIVSLVVGAGTWVAGTTYEFYAHCEYVRSGAPATSHTVTIDAELNGAAVGITLSSVSGVQNSATANVLLSGTFTCSATGGGGTGRAAIAIDENILLGSAAALSRWAGTSNPALDTTASNTLSITVDFSAGVAGASFVCQRAWIRRVV